MNSGAPVISIPYCAAQYLLSGEYADAYTSGVYGWNADVYSFDGTYIVTGYRPFGNVSIPYDVIKAAETAAANVTGKTYDDVIAGRRQILAKLIDLYAYGITPEDINVYNDQVAAAGE